MYNKGEETYVPKISNSKQGKKEWFSKRCEEERNKKEKAWKKWRNNKHQNLWV